MKLDDVFLRIAIDQNEDDEENEYLIEQNASNIFNQKFV